MDRIDIQILKLLDRNCRLSFESMARSVGVSANAVKNRVDRMKEAGIISSYMVGFSSTMVGAEHFWALVRTDGNEDPDELLDRFGAIGTIAHVSRIVSAVGGMYHVIGEYIGNDMLLSASTSLRSLPNVVTVELHLFEFLDGGGRLEMKKAHLRILRCLHQDARMTISEISEQTGFTARRVNRLLEELLDSRAILLSVRWNLAEGATEFLVRVECDSRIISEAELSRILFLKYPQELWYSFPSLAEPITILTFVVDNLKEAEAIANEIRRMNGVRTATPMTVFSSKKFPWLIERRLAQTLDEAGV